MKMNIKNMLAMMLALTMTIGLAACGDTEAADTDSKATTTTTTAAEESAPESEAEEESEVESEAESQADSQPEEDIKYLGEKDAAAADYSVELKNGTDKTIVGFAIKYGSDAYSDNLLPEGEEFAADEVRQFNWSHTVSGDVMTLDDFTVELTFDDYEVFELHGFPLTDMIDGEIRLMEDYAFLVYTNKIGDSKNTMDSEAAIVERAREEDEAATTTTYIEPEYDEPEYEEPDNNEPEYEEPPVATDPPATDAPVIVPPSADDGCVGDDGFTF